MTQTPHASVKARFESKEKLVAALQKLATPELWVDRVSAVKGLGRVSNAKLLRLHTILTDAKERFGSRQKLIVAISELARRQKDQDWVKALERYPLPRLLDMHRSLDRRAKRGGAEPEKPAGARRANKYPPKAEKAPAARAEAPAKEKPAKAEAKSAPKVAKAPASKPAASKSAASKATGSKPAASKAPAKKAAVKKVAEKKG